MAALPHAHPMTIPSSRLSPALRYMESAKVGWDNDGDDAALELSAWGRLLTQKHTTYRQKNAAWSHRVRRLRRNQEGHSCCERETAPYPRLHSASRLEGWLHPGE